MRRGDKVPGFNTSLGSSDGRTPDLPIWFVDESTINLDYLDFHVQPGDIMALPPDFRFIELDPKTLKMKEGGFVLQKQEDGTVRFNPNGD